MERGSEGASIDRSVFGIAVGISVLFVLWGVLFTDNLASVASTTLSYLISTYGWVFVLATFGFLLFVGYLALSRYGKVRLGRDDDRPEFRTTSWIAMMFSAGMGIGLMFFGVAEPILHFAAPPHGAATAGSEEAARVAMQYSYFHWALHPWAIYAVVGLALAYSTFRKGRRNLISSAFYPILGDKVDGPIGKAINILAIFATLFGTATSLGLGALQINGGLNYLWGVSNSVTVAILVILAITALFTISAVTGVHRGIKYLSEINMVLAAILLLFLLVVGPTVFIFNIFTESLGAYVSSLVSMSFRTAASGDEEWLAAYTLFYWAWWISWTPFVGMFIARISKGRTIREFVFGVLLVPSVVSLVWFAVFGGTAINLDLTGATGLAATAAESPANSLFETLNEFPLAAVMSLLAIILVGLFFVSGADAGAVVMGILSSNGALRPRTWTLVTWGVLTGLAAAVLLLAGGNNALQSLQQAAIIAAAPFLLVMIAMCYSLFKELRAERLPQTREAPEPERAATRPSGTPAPQQTSATEPNSGR
ncbi:MAG TPA: BCCT family transporter [Rubrobacteraceae bacterium]|nr:BCCT family transporter [Rubrobacteraceae bacterium]